MALQNIAGYSSRKTTTDGSWVNATGILEPMEEPGHFTQTLEFFGIPVRSILKSKATLTNTIKTKNE